MTRNIPLETADFTGPGGAAAMSRLLEAREHPSPVVFADDIMAIVGMSVAAQAGVVVPRDLLIVGSDDVPLEVHVNPPPTTVRQEVSLWARAAAAHCCRQWRTDSPPLCGCRLHDSSFALRLARPGRR